jgi:hypothetical protein
MRVGDGITTLRITDTCGSWKPESRRAASFRRAQLRAGTLRVTTSTSKVNWDQDVAIPKDHVPINRIAKISTRIPNISFFISKRSRISGMVSIRIYCHLIFLQ